MSKHDRDDWTRARRRLLAVAEREELIDVAVRAAGTALASNPMPIVVPCHRVLRSDGAHGDYRGGAEAKVQLLELEGAL